MKKDIKKLTLNRETIQQLGYVTGAVSAETMCGYTCIRQCQLVPSVDVC
jgi:hypothetical protein